MENTNDLTKYIENQTLIELIIGRIKRENEIVSLTQRQKDEIEFWRVLLNEEIITLENIEMIKDIQRFKKEQVSINEIILERNLASEKEIVTRLYKYHKDLYENSIMKIVLTDEELLSIKNFDYNFKKSVCEEKGHILFYVNETQRIVNIAVSTIMNISELDNTKRFYKDKGYTRYFYRTTTLELSLLQKKLYDDRNYDKEQLFKYIKGDKEFGDCVKEFFSKVIEIATLKNASDIYMILEKDTEFSEIFFRLNREKTYGIVIPTENIDVLFTTIKNERNMRSGEKRGHQDGSMIVKILNNKFPVNLRINTITCTDEEQMTIRLQSGDTEILKDIGLHTEDYKVIKEKLKVMEGGIVCLVGATGSGKSRTIRRCLNEFDFRKRNIITMERPVEVKMKGIRQININPQRGQSFEESIRRCMRQRPDILVIGEIRDKETREKRFEARSTGHLVFTTIHRANIEGIRERIDSLKLENIDGFMESLKICMYQKLVKENNKMNLKYEIKFDDRKIIDRGILEITEKEKQLSEQNNSN